MSWLGCISDSMDMILSKLRKLLGDRGACRAAVHRVVKSWTQLNDWATTALSNNNATHLEEMNKLFTRGQNIYESFFWNSIKKYQANTASLLKLNQKFHHETKTNKVMKQPQLWKSDTGTQGNSQTIGDNATHRKQQILVLKTEEREKAFWFFTLIVFPFF